VDTPPSSTFVGRHEFFLRRLHSLTGLVPIGAYLVMHLLVNSTLLSGPTTYQKNVYQIHGLEDLLVFVEWGLILLPILFHGVVGLWIWQNGQSNVWAYPHMANYRYMLQRTTGMIAFAFIVWHVFHVHGWFHFDAWRKVVAEPLFGAQFRPYNAASTLAQAMRPGGVWGLIVPAVYVVGMTACVFHLANGIWAAGIVWGAWTSPSAQRSAAWGCAAFGLFLTLVGLGSLIGVARVDVQTARAKENAMYELRTQMGDIKPNADKRVTE